MARHSPALDATDKRLLAKLRENARLSVAQLAKLLQIPRSQVYARLARFKREEIVVGFTVRLGAGFTGTRVRALVMVKTLPRCHREVERALAGIAEVTIVHAISGEYDIVARLEAANSVELNNRIDDIGVLDGVERTTTSVILATKFER